LLALERARGRIVSGIHAGQLNGGDRLASYREIAQQLGVDVRAAGRIYGRLATEGLVEIRTKTGVYVASQERMGGRVLVETADWVVELLGDAWRRRISIKEFPELARRCVATIELQTACIESTEDQLVTLCSELARDFGLSTTPVHADLLPSLHEVDDLQACVPPSVAKADFLTTTAFHASALRGLAQALCKPLIVFRLDAEFTNLVQRQLQVGDLTVICVDPRFLERFRGVLAAQYPERVRGVLANDPPALSRILIDQPVLVTNAAARILDHRNLPSSIHPPGAPVMSADTATELIELIVRMNLEAVQHEPS
jgi:DNA-binding transcriptional regulator YhcF (GntR family)